MMYAFEQKSHAFEFIRLLEAEKDLQAELIQERSLKFCWVLEVSEMRYSMGIGLPTRADFYQRAGTEYLDRLKIDPMDFFDQYIEPCLVATGRMMLVKGEKFDRTFMPYCAFKCNGIRVSLVGCRL